MNAFKLRIFLLIILFILLAGCNSDTTSNATVEEAHKNYISSFGWSIDSKLSEVSETIQYRPELIGNLKAAGIDLGPFQGKEATITTYLLEEKQKTDDHLRVTIFEVDGRIIGGYGSLENWEPGLFSLEGKERLVRDGIIH